MGRLFPFLLQQLMTKRLKPAIEGSTTKRLFFSLQRVAAVVAVFCRAILSFFRDELMMDISWWKLHEGFRRRGKKKLGEGSKLFQAISREEQRDSLLLGFIKDVKDSIVARYVATSKISSCVSLSEFTPAETVWRKVHSRYLKSQHLLNPSKYLSLFWQHSLIPLL